jgi:hypothetical protein
MQGIFPATGDWPIILPVQTIALDGLLARMQKQDQAHV